MGASQHHGLSLSSTSRKCDRNSGGCRWLYNGLPEANKVCGLLWQLVTPIQVMFQHFILSDSLISILIVMFSSKKLLWRFYCKLVDAFSKVVSPFWSLALWSDHDWGSLGWNLFSLEFQLVTSYTTVVLKNHAVSSFPKPKSVYGVWSHVLWPFLECWPQFYNKNTRVNIILTCGWFHTKHKMSQVYQFWILIGIHNIFVISTKKCKLNNIKANLIYSISVMEFCNLPFYCHNWQSSVKVLYVTPKLIIIFYAKFYFMHFGEVDKYFTYFFDRLGIYVCM